MSMKTKWRPAGVAVVAFLGAATLALSGCSSTGDAPEKTTEASALFHQELHDALPASVVDAGSLKVASSLNDELFGYKKGAELTGIIPELGVKLGEVLGVDVDFVDTPFPGMIPALQANRVDLIWATMNDTVEREQTIDFVNWLRTGSSFMVPPGNPDDVAGIEDICGLKAATLRGAVPLVELMEAQSEKCVEAGKPAVDINLYDDFPSGMTQLRSGQIQTFFGPSEKLNFIVNTSDGASGFEVVDATYLGGVYGIGVTKENAALSKTILGALKVLADSGDYDEILEKWQNSDNALTPDEFQINGTGAGAFE